MHEAELGVDVGLALGASEGLPGFANEWCCAGAGLGGRGGGLFG